MSVSSGPNPESRTVRLSPLPSSDEGEVEEAELPSAVMTETQSVTDRQGSALTLREESWLRKKLRAPIDSDRDVDSKYLIFVVLVAFQVFAWSVVIIGQATRGGFNPQSLIFIPVLLYSLGASIYTAKTQKRYSRVPASIALVLAILLGIWFTWNENRMGIFPFWSLNVMVMYTLMELPLKPWWFVCMFLALVINLLFVIEQDSMFDGRTFAADRIRGEPALGLMNWGQSYDSTISTRNMIIFGFAVFPAILCYGMMERLNLIHKDNSEMEAARVAAEAFNRAIARYDTDAAVTVLEDYHDVLDPQLRSALEMIVSNMVMYKQFLPSSLIAQKIGVDGAANHDDAEDHEIRGGNQNGTAAASSRSVSPAGALDQSAAEDDDADIDLGATLRSVALGGATTPQMSSLNRPTSHSGGGQGSTSIRLVPSMSRNSSSVRSSNTDEKRRGSTAPTSITAADEPNNGDDPASLIEVMASNESFGAQVVMDVSGNSASEAGSATQSGLPGSNVFPNLLTPSGSVNRRSAPSSGSQTSKSSPSVSQKRNGDATMNEFLMESVGSSDHMVTAVAPTTSRPMSSSAAGRGGLRRVASIPGQPSSVVHGEGSSRSGGGGGGGSASTSKSGSSTSYPQLDGSTRNEPLALPPERDAFDSSGGSNVTTIHLGRKLSESRKTNRYSSALAEFTQNVKQYRESSAADFSDDDQTSPSIPKTVLEDAPLPFFRAPKVVIALVHFHSFEKLVGPQMADVPIMTPKRKDTSSKKNLGSTEKTVKVPQTMKIDGVTQVRLNPADVNGLSMTMEKDIARLAQICKQYEASIQMVNGPVALVAWGLRGEGEEDGDEDSGGGQKEKRKKKKDYQDLAANFAVALRKAFVVGRVDRAEDPLSIANATCAVSAAIGIGDVQFGVVGDDETKHLCILGPFLGNDQASPSAGGNYHHAIPANSPALRVDHSTIVQPFRKDLDAATTTTSSEFGEDSSEGRRGSSSVRRYSSSKINLPPSSSSSQPSRNESPSRAGAAAVERGVVSSPMMPPPLNPLSRHESEEATNTSSSPPRSGATSHFDGSQDNTISSSQESSPTSMPRRVSNSYLTASTEQGALDQSSTNSTAGLPPLVDPGHFSSPTSSSSSDWDLLYLMLDAAKFHNAIVVSAQIAETLEGAYHFRGIDAVRKSHSPGGWIGSLKTSTNTTAPIGGEGGVPGASTSATKFPALGSAGKYPPPISSGGSPALHGPLRRPTSNLVTALTLEAPSSSNAAGDSVSSLGDTQFSVFSPPRDPKTPSTGGQRHSLTLGALTGAGGGSLSLDPPPVASPYPPPLNEHPQHQHTTSWITEPPPLKIYEVVSSIRDAVNESDGEWMYILKQNGEFCDAMNRALDKYCLGHYDDAAECLAGLPPQQQRDRKLVLLEKHAAQCRAASGHLLDEKPVPSRNGTTEDGSGETAQTKLWYCCEIGFKS